MLFVKTLWAKYSLTDSAGDWISIRPHKSLAVRSRAETFVGIFIDFVSEQYIQVFLSLLRRSIFDQIWPLIQKNRTLFTETFYDLELFQLSRNMLFYAAIAKLVLADGIEHDHILLFNFSKANWAFDILSQYFLSLPFVVFLWIFVLKFLSMLMYFNIFRNGVLRFLKFQIPSFFNFDQLFALSRFLYFFTLT